MRLAPHSFFAHWRHDVPAALVVFLVALPLCLGIALASGAPLVSGLVAGIVGGIVVGFFSRSPLSVSGPAAGLTVIVLGAIQEIGDYEKFLTAVCIAGGIQLLLGICRVGVLGDFIPSAVVKGMLAAIGLILIMKQIPHAVGYDADYVGDETFAEMHGGENTFSALWHMLSHITPAAVVIAGISLVFLFAWDSIQPKLRGPLRYLPGPLVVVGFGIGASLTLRAFLPEYAISPEHMVAVPVSDSLQGYLAQLRFPDFSGLDDGIVWKMAITLALVASIESLLSIEAIDRLDPWKRVTPTSRELMAQGAGNLVSGLIGGIPVTSVIVRSSANVSAGARSRLSTMTHGVLLLASVLTIPTILNLIPLSALAAILLSVGYKLAKPSIFREQYQKGASYIVPFVTTIAAILLTDLLIGIGIGVAVGLAFVVKRNLTSAISVVSDEENYLVRCRKDLFFIHKFELKQKLDRIPDGSKVLLDLSRISFVDLDNVDVIRLFVDGAFHRGITVTLKRDLDNKVAPLLGVQHEAA